jgi:hypothetical protein
MTYGYVFLRRGQPRVPLFEGRQAPWEKVGPLVKQIVDGDVVSGVT